MDLNEFSVFPMLWGPKPAEWEEVIALVQHVEEFGYYSHTKLPRLHRALRGRAPGGRLDLGPDP